MAGLWQVLASDRYSTAQLDPSSARLSSHSYSRLQSHRRRCTVRPTATSRAGEGNTTDVLLHSLRRLDRRALVLGGLGALSGHGFNQVAVFAAPNSPPDRSSFGWGASTVEVEDSGQVPFSNTAVGFTIQTAGEIEETTTSMAAEFPLTLSSTVSTVVKRPRPSRSEQEKAAMDEVLVVRDIDLEPTIFAKFDVFINAPDPTGLTPLEAQFAGSFSSLPRKKREGATGIKPITTNLLLGLSDLLEEIGAEGDDTIVVTLVPRTGEVKIGGVGIEFIKIR